MLGCTPSPSSLSSSSHNLCKKLHLHYLLPPLTPESHLHHTITTVHYTPSDPKSPLTYRTNPYHSLIPHIPARQKLYSTTFALSSHPPPSTLRTARTFTVIHLTPPSPLINKNPPFLTTPSLVTGLGSTVYRQSPSPFSSLVESNGSIFRVDYFPGVSGGAG